MIDIICSIGSRMYDRGLISACEGNISVRTGENEIWTTPTGVCKGQLSPEMLVRTDLNGVPFKGTPSSELKMHLRIYKERADINAIVHAHPVYASVYAVMGKGLTAKYLTESVITLGNVAVAPYATPSTDQVGESIIPYLHDSKAVLLANHGALTWGKTLEEAYNLMDSLEACAKITYLVDLAGGGREITLNEAETLRRAVNKPA